MSPASRVLTNTFVSYSRTIVSVLFGMFSIRWVLAALGKEDFGLYTVVGSLISFLSFFNNILGISIARFYAYSLGRITDNGLNTDLRGWFNTALSLHVCVPLVLVLVGYPIGAYAIRHWISIPVVRMDACIWVFRITVVSTFVGMVSIPFTAMFTARQMIAEVSVISMVGTVLNFVLAFSLTYAPFDRLVFYALYMAIIFSGLPLFQVVWAACRFPECRLSFRDWFNHSRIKSLLGFAGWTTFGFGGYIFSSQGNVLVTNHFFGAAINSAYGIANQITMHVQSLSNALVGALSPAITTRAGTGDMQGTVRLAYRSGKLGAFLLILFAVPMALEMPTILQVWLKNPPEYVVPVCRVVLCGLLVSKLTIGHQMAMNANGKIAKWQIVEGCSLASAVAFALMFIRIGGGPVSASCGYLVSMILSAIGVLLFCQIMLGMKMLDWLSKVVLPIVLTLVLGLLSGCLVVFSMQPSLIRVMLTSGTVVFVSGLTGWFRVLEESERKLVFDRFKTICAIRK